MLIDIEDSQGKPTGKQRILIPTFDLYSKNISDNTCRKFNTTFAYEILTTS